MQKDQTNENIKNIQPKKEIQSQQNNKEMRDLIEGIYNKYYAHIQFNDIDYLIGQPPQGMLPENNEIYSDLIVILDNCLIVKQKGFDKLYGELMKTVINPNQNWSFRNKCSDILITLNGENDKVYNLKKQSIANIQKSLSNNKGYEKDLNNVIDLKRELVLNSAVIMKFKKTSSCYEYRYRLVETLLKIQQKNTANFPQFLRKFQKEQHKLMKKILQRFYRNYFCWMYRLRLFKLILKFEQKPQIYLTEFGYVYEFLERNPNDHSCYSYIMFLFKNLGIGKNQCLKENENQQKRQIEFENQKCKQQISQKIQGLLQFYKLAYTDNTKYKYLSQLQHYLKQSK